MEGKVDQQGACSTDANETAAAQDLGRSAYFLVSSGGTTTCVQRTYAHRDQMHLLSSQFKCTNSGAAGAATVVLTEPGPSMMPLRGFNWSLRGQFAKAAPLGEVQSDSVSSGWPGVSCSRVEVRKTPFLRHCYTTRKLVILPRQARDKHIRKNSKKKGVLCRSRLPSRRTALVRLSASAIHCATAAPSRCRPGPHRLFLASPRGIRPLIRTLRRLAASRLR
jgi:hypothetical protein